VILAKVPSFTCFNTKKYTAKLGVTYL